jgi:hypothetical protein
VLLRVGLRVQSWLTWSQRCDAATVLLFTTRISWRCCGMDITAASNSCVTEVFEIRPDHMPCAAVSQHTALALHNMQQQRGQSNHCQNPGS